jgi:putative ABC transport system substrate-binding protein
VLLAGAAAWPLAAHAQSGLRRVGVLMALAQDDPEAGPRADALRAGLEGSGWVAGRNLQLDIRWGTGDGDATRRAAMELVDLRPDVIVANGTPATTEVVKLTKTIPVVFALVSDPVGAGLVPSFANPGGNVTGYVNFEPSLITKWVELLLEVDPTLARVIMVFNPDSAPGAGMYFMEPFTAAAATSKIKTEAAMVRSDSEIEAMIAAFAARGRGAIVVPPDVFNTAHRSAIISAVARAKLPAVYPYRYYAADGGLMSYGIDTIDVFRQVGGYAARVLNGARPGELPVQSPSKFEFVINEKTAGTLGIAIPSTLLARADAVIG